MRVAADPMRQNFGTRAITGVGVSGRGRQRVTAKPCSTRGDRERPGGGALARTAWLSPRPSGNTNSRWWWLTNMNSATLTTTTTTTTSPEDAAHALATRGVMPTTITALVGDSSSDLIVAWCTYASQQRQMGPGAVVDCIRSGRQPPETPRRANTHDQSVYARQIVQWLTEKMPAVCRASSKIVEAERRLYGDPSADRLAASTSPHPAAIATVIRLHYAQGRALTVATHGQVIKDAVKASDERALADYRAIAKARENQQEA